MCECVQRLQRYVKEPEVYVLEVKHGIQRFDRSC